MERERIVALNLAAELREKWSQEEKKEVKHRSKQNQSWGLQVGKNEEQVQVLSGLTSWMGQVKAEFHDALYDRIKEWNLMVPVTNSTLRKNQVDENRQLIVRVNSMEASEKKLADAFGRSSQTNHSMLSLMVREDVKMVPDVHSKLSARTLASTPAIVEELFPGFRSQPTLKNFVRKENKGER